MNQLHAAMLLHRGAQCIALRFPFDKTFISALQDALQIRWSATNRCWYCGDTTQNREVLTGVCEANNYTLNMTTSPEDVLTVNLPSAAGVSLENNKELEDFRSELILKGYSPSTLRTYLNEFIQFLRALKNTSAVAMDSERLRNYFKYCAERLNLTEATLHSRVNAVKFYYEQVLRREKFFYDIPRPKKHVQLPKVLAEQEISRMFGSLKNLKHKALLFVAYSAGLRVSEVVRLKLRDIDVGRMQIFVERAKGKKDRYVNLSILLLDLLREYINKVQPRPQTYLFENSNEPGKPYSIRATQKVFAMAKDMAGISKAVGFHSLRHSFATHMLEKGVDLRYIKDLLGHFDIRTTERYLHVRREALINLPDLLAELNTRAAASLDAPDTTKKRPDFLL